MLAMLFVTMTLTACDAPKKYQGKYEYSTSSYITVHKTTYDYENVYLGTIVFADETQLANVYVSGIGYGFDVEKIQAGVFKVTTEKTFANGTVTIFSYLYDNYGGTPIVGLAGRSYFKDE